MRRANPNDQEYSPCHRVLTGKAISSSRSSPARARGYGIGKGQCLLVEDEELEAIEIASTYTIDIDSFVPAAEIDRRFFDTPYYITPNDPVGQEAFAVIREVMRSKALVALGRVVLAKRERVIAFDPHEKGLIAISPMICSFVRGTVEFAPKAFILQGNFHPTRC